MGDHSVGDWLKLVGGAAPYREAIIHGFSHHHGDHDNSVESLASTLEAKITIVFCNSEENFGILAAATAAQDAYVIGIVPDLDLRAYHRVLHQGAAGVVWEDTPVGHLADVTRAALNHDILLPVELVRTITSGDLEQDRTVSDLDPATHAILHALAEGLSQREIARALSYSERTIQRRTTNLCLALGALTPAQAVHFAHRRGMLR